MSSCKDQVGVRIRYELPDPEWQALERIVRARGDGIANEGLVTQAVIAWFEAGHPPCLVPAAYMRLSAESVNTYQAVTWWLRRGDAREIFAPAKLAAEALRCAAAGELDACIAAQAQLSRIIMDLEHPDRELARTESLAMMPEPLRSYMAERLDRAEALVRPPKAEA